MPAGFAAIKRTRRSNYGALCGQDVSQGSNSAGSTLLANTIWISIVQLQSFPLSWMDLSMGCQNTNNMTPSANNFSNPEALKNYVSGTVNGGKIGREY